MTDSSSSASLTVYLGAGSPAASRSLASSGVSTAIVFWMYSAGGNWAARALIFSRSSAGMPKLAKIKFEQVHTKFK